MARHGAWIAVGIVMIGVAVIRLRLAAAPLERDEGEYAYAGQLLLDGVPPYTLAYNMKFPGTYYAYALILRLFGQSPWGIHAGLLLINAASTVLLFAIGRRLMGSLGGAVAGVLFAVLSLDAGVLGTHAHATHFTLVPLLAGVLALQEASRSNRTWRWAAAGALMSAATLTGQQGAFFLPLGVFLALWPLRRGAHPGPSARMAWFLAGVAGPLLAMAALLAADGVLSRAWFWTIAYARAYISEVSWDSAWQLFIMGWGEVTHATWPIWVLAACGLVLTLAPRYADGTRRTAVGLLVAGACAISPGFYYRNHYFVLVLPAVALLAAVAVTAAARVADRICGRFTLACAIAALIPLGLVSTYAVTQRRYLLEVSPLTLNRETFGSDTFNEAPRIAAYLRDHTGPDDRIAVLGSEPEIYFYAHRKSATGYIYMYPLLERQPYAQSMQLEMLDEIQSAQPAYLVVVSVTDSWFNGLYGGVSILNWTKQYTARCYEQVDAVETDRVGGRVYTFRRKGVDPCRVPPG